MFRFYLKFTISFLVVVLIASGCKSSLIIDRSEISDIPGGATQVYAFSPVSADSLFIYTSRLLTQRGWIVREAKASNQISCDPKMVKGGVHIKPLIKIESNDEGSVAIYSGVWSLRPMHQDRIDFIVTQAENRTERITWKGYKTKPGLAFQNLIMMAKRGPQAQIRYKN